MKDKKPGQPLKFSAVYADLYELPPEMIGEIVQGDLYASPRPARRHAVANGAIYVQLTNEFQYGRSGPGGWVFLTEPELHLDGNVLVPDVAGWRRERYEQDEGKQGFTVAPDWLCEVLSPSTEDIDKRRKMPAYAAAGIPHVWLVDPLIKAVSTFELAGDRYRERSLYMKDGIAQIEPFDELDFDLSLLWNP